MTTENQASGRIAELPESRYEAALQLWREWFEGGGRNVPPIPDDTSLMLQWIVGRFRAATRETRGTAPPHDLAKVADKAAGWLCILAEFFQAKADPARNPHMDWLKLAEKTKEVENELRAAERVSQPVAGHEVPMKPRELGEAGKHLRSITREVPINPEFASDPDTEPDAAGTHPPQEGA